MRYSSPPAPRRAANSASRANKSTACFTGVEFLRDAASAGKPAVKDRVLVIGGGNVAVDVARTALRLGARRVEMVCLEQRDEMPAYKEEIEATLAEHITHPQWLGAQAHYGQRFGDRHRAQTMHPGL